MQTYQIVFETYDHETNQFEALEASYEAEDVLHAVNQLLDTYRNLSDRISSIDSVELVP